MDYKTLRAAIATQVGPTFGRIFVVMPSTDTANYDKISQLFNVDPEGVVRVFTTFEAAYAMVTSNADDVILLAGYGTHTLSAMVSMSKSRVHVIGLDLTNNRLNSQPAKLSIATAVATDVATIYNTGTRNTFKNIKFIQSGTDVASLYAFVDAGEGTYMENCDVEHNTILSTANVASILFAGDTCTYVNCQFGNSTVYRTGNPSQAMLVGKYGSAYARYSYFKDCKFVSYSSQTASRCVGTTGATHVIGWLEFDNCSFINAKLGDGATAGGAMAVAVVSALSSGYIYLKHCASFNAVLIASTHASVLNAGPASAATAGGGLAVAGA